MDLREIAPDRDRSEECEDDTDPPPMNAHPRNPSFAALFAGLCSNLPETKRKEDELLLPCNLRHLRTKIFVWESRQEEQQTAGIAPVPAPQWQASERRFAIPFEIISDLVPDLYPHCFSVRFILLLFF